jgi:hypothetical protein
MPTPNFSIDAADTPRWRKIDGALSVAPRFTAYQSAARVSTPWMLPIAADLGNALRLQPLKAASGFPMAADSVGHFTGRRYAVRAFVAIQIRALSLLDPAAST